MTSAAKPPLGATITDAEFGATIRRITGAGVAPLYSTVPAWNADESLLMLFDVGSGTQQLYDGKTYAFISNLPTNAADIEQVYWHVTDLNVFYYVDGKDFKEFHVDSNSAVTLSTFSSCSGRATGGSDPQFTSFDSRRIGLLCGTTQLLYDIPSKTVIAQKTVSGESTPGQATPSGTLTYRSDSGWVTDAALNPLRKLDLREPSPFKVNDSFGFGK